MVQLWGVDPVEQTCLCGGRASCSGGRNAGKHPIGAGWPERATCDVEALRRAEREHPGSNYGAATGDRFIVFDVDPRHGGDRSLAEQERALGPRPATVRVRTGGGGWHELYRVPTGHRIPNAKLLAGVDVRGTGGQVVLPGSVHGSGRRYAWEPGASPDDVAIAALPTPWLELLLDVLESTPRRAQDGRRSHARMRRAPGAGQGRNARPVGTRDESRSAEAWRSAKAAHARGVTRETWEHELADEANGAPEATWHREQVDAGDQRQLDRVWERSRATLTHDERAAEALARIQQHRAAVLGTTALQPTLRKVLLATLDLLAADSTPRKGIGCRDVAALAQTSPRQAARWLAEAVRAGWLRILAPARGTKATLFGLPDPAIVTHYLPHVALSSPARADSGSQLQVGLRALGAEAFHREFAGVRGLGPTFELVAGVLEVHAEGVHPAELARKSGRDARTVQRALAQGAAEEPVGGRVVIDTSQARLVSRRGKDGRMRPVRVGVRRRIEGARVLPFPLFERTAAGAWRWRTTELRARVGLGTEVDARDVHAAALVEVERWLGLDHVAERKAERFELERVAWREECAQRRVEREAEHREALDALLAEPPEKYLADEPDWLPELPGEVRGALGRSGERPSLLISPPKGEQVAQRPERRRDQGQGVRAPKAHEQKHDQGGDLPVGRSVVVGGIEVTRIDPADLDGCDELHDEWDDAAA